MKKNNLLTVNIVTYNHVEWIAQCIDSILSQKTNFGVVIRIFDDCSSDGTTEICQQYAKKFPKKIQFFPAEKNLGTKNGILLNAWRSYEHIETPYYLYIEGDDFRLTKNGLQKQVEVLEKNRDCAFCMSSTINLKNGDYSSLHPFLNEGVYSLDFVKKHPEKLYFSNLGSRIVRTKCIKIDPDYPRAYIRDLTQMYELFAQGSMYFIDEPLFCYRITGKGLSTGDDYFSKMQRILSDFVCYNQYTNNVWELYLQKNYSVEASAVFNYNLLQFLNCDKLKKIKKKTYLKELAHKIFPEKLFVFIKRLRDCLRVLRGTRKVI